MFCYTLQNPQTCTGVDDLEPMCGCKDGFLLDDNDNCIPKESCSCYLMNGNSLAIGMEVEEECDIWYFFLFKYIFVIVYVHYLCLFAYSGVQHILCWVFALFSVVVPYVASFSRLSFFLIAPSVFSLVYLICLKIFYIYLCKKIEMFNISSLSSNWRYSQWP